MTSPAHETAPAPSRRNVGLAIVALLIAVGAAYHNSFSVPFLYDDVPAIAANPTIQRLWPLGPVLSPPAHLTTSGRPLVNLTLALNYAIGGIDVRGYHALNVAIHAFATLVLFGLVRRTLHRPACGRALGGDATGLAFTVAAVWALHPLQTESVTYIVQRAESLVGLWYLLTLYCFVRAAERMDPRVSAPDVGRGLPTPPRLTLQQRVDRRGQETPPYTPGAEELPLWPAGSDSAAGPVERWTTAGALWASASVVCCALGMATKEVMASAPLLVLLYDRTFVSGTFAASWRRHRRLYLGLGATWLLLAGLVFSTGGTRDGSAGFGQGMSSWTYALTQAKAIVTYLRLALVPHGLVFDYGNATVGSLAQAMPYALAVLALLAATVVALCRWPALGFLGCWFFAILAPSSSVVPVVTETMAEHRMYLPLAAVVLAVAVACHAWLGRRTAWVLAAAAVGLGGLTVRRTEVYQTPIGLWRDTVAKLPGNGRAHNQLGSALFAAGREAEAMPEYEEALRLQPSEPKAHFNYATALYRTGHVQESLAHFEAALRLKTNQPDEDVHTNYGLALMQLGRRDEAIAQYRRALQIDPTFAPAHNNLGIALGSAGQLAEAVQHFQAALRERPDYADAHNNLGHALVELGRVEAAIPEFEAALRFRDDYAEAHNNLARAYDQLGRTADAVTEYREVLRLEPTYADGHCALGIALRRLGQVEAAEAELETALRLVPGHATARQELAALRSGRQAAWPVPASKP
jgi:protein O-mannosyl-transferase